MNFGGCPYDGCNGDLMAEIPERTPCYARIICPACDRPVWYRFSRADPAAWTEADFLGEFAVDPDTHQITHR